MFFRVNEGQSELVIKRSRFIAISRNVSSREDVRNVVAELKKQHRDARHVCSAFIADDVGQNYGYDDDGEPQGTAGKPIYTALTASNVRRSMIAVVRYFGGIKLGAGGLTHAYRDSAQLVIDEVGVSAFKIEKAFDVVVRGDAYKKVQAVLYNCGCRLEKIIYNQDVCFTAISPCGIDVEKAISPFGAIVTGGRELIVSA